MPLLAMVGVASGSLEAAYRQIHSPGRLAWSGGGRLAPFQTHEPGELSKWLSRDDSTIITIVLIIVTLLN